ncbi:unnamed protein product [Orchesella dallaii]|uniref:Uncharacterized protein n=1 Tax=Orchesella dallaii TaxID=48710 RepID=A0ABP1QKG7_9HEXA
MNMEWREEKPGLACPRPTFTLANIITFTQGRKTFTVFLHTYENIIGKTQKVNIFCYKVQHTRVKQL